jgi:NAD(P)-dependent dehydrogenase (short-subunit alcohol dehydrogenase family)
MQDLIGKVVVVTGASGGLGRETALRFAREGSHLVLAARREQELEEVARGCRLAGGTALCVVTDVTRESDVQHLLELTLKEFGRIDVWINNAGVTVFGYLDQVPFEEHRRVIETNLYGAMYAARAIVPVFTKQHHGVLINVGSILSKVGQPFVPSYVISKFALRGLTEALRAQLADYRDIHVCSIFPYAIDTQHFEAGANFVGREARAMPPVQSPEKVAAAIVDLARRPRPSLHVPRVAVLGLMFRAVFPRTSERMLLHALREWHFGDEVEPRTAGNLFRPSDEKAAVHGKRPPQISTVGLLSWLVRHFVKRKAAKWNNQLRSARPMMP